LSNTLNSFEGVVFSDEEVLLDMTGGFLNGSLDSKDFVLSPVEDADEEEGLRSLLGEGTITLSSITSPPIGLER
jgi:hypothetical protein